MRPLTPDGVLAGLDPTDLVQSSIIYHHEAFHAGGLERLHWYLTIQEYSYRLKLVGCEAL